MTPSPARLAANQANARLSTGPITPEGKQKSSLNALRHGLTGQTVVMPNEDAEIYLNFAREYTNALRPEGPIEHQFAQAAADVQWRLNRARTIEDAMFALALSNAESDAVSQALALGQTFQDHSRAFANLSICEHRLRRAQEKALAQLKALQTEREAKHNAAMEEAILLKQFDEMENRTFHPAEYGFVFSNAQVAAAINRRHRYEQAKKAEAHGFNSQRCSRAA